MYVSNVPGTTYLTLCEDRSLHPVYYMKANQKLPVLHKSTPFRANHPVFSTRYIL